MEEKSDEYESQKRHRGQGEAMSGKRRAGEFPEIMKSSDSGSTIVLNRIKKKEKPALSTW